MKDQLSAFIYFKTENRVEQLVASVIDQIDWKLKPVNMFEKVLESFGYERKDIKILWIEFEEFTSEDGFEESDRSVSPSFKYFDPVYGAGTSPDKYKSYPGGSPGLGRRKS